jgi:hypothetical protein
MLVDLLLLALIQLFNELQARNNLTQHVEHISKPTVRDHLQFVYQARIGELAHAQPQYVISDAGLGVEGGAVDGAGIKPLV